MRRYGKVEQVSIWLENARHEEVMRPTSRVGENLISNRIVSDAINCIRVFLLRLRHYVRTARVIGNVDGVMQKIECSVFRMPNPERYGVIPFPECSLCAPTYASFSKNEYLRLNASRNCLPFYVSKVHTRSHRITQLLRVQDRNGLPQRLLFSSHAVLCVGGAVA